MLPNLRCCATDFIYARHMCAAAAANARRRVKNGSNTFFGLLVVDIIFWPNVWYTARVRTAFLSLCFGYSSI